ncbi:cellulase family glycosylhydrolase [Vibrio sp. 10N.286.52.B1]|uniref:cellulase family glycosylhydrolase n=1 Tax=Vibrio sp. 10N.286.52.B1 TaxID=3229712 RepID=UPI00354F6083
MSMGVHAGFSVQTGTLIDNNGNPFVMRGINHAHTWYTSKLSTSLDGIATHNANTVRVVISNGHRWSKTSNAEIADIIAQAKARQLITVLDVHDTTGFGEEGSAASLSSAVDYWLTLKDQLVGQEDYVIINIGNEPFGNNVTVAQWVDAHKNAIKRLRDAGLTHTLMVDAPNWGQDWQDIMRYNANQVFDADPQKNVVFSVHMYEVFNNYNTINTYISDFQNRGIALVIGEFSQTHKGHFVDADAIMERANTLNVGYLGWSWSGNDNSTADLDIALNWNANNLSSWGHKIINGSNGIKATAKVATVFSSSSEPSDPSQYPICSTDGLDPDNDGWGWENNQSCKVNPYGYAPNGSPYCSSSTVDPDNDGWGWENELSCVVK